MHQFRLPHYFSHGMRRQVDELFASTTIADFALAMILLFEPIYFVVVLGWQLTHVLLFFAGVYALYILFIPFGAKIAARFGYEHAMLYSIPFQIGYWLLLFNAGSNNWFIYLAAFALAIEKSLFWPAFHADLARFSDKDQRSREYSLIYALVHLVHIFGPFIGGVISYNFGVRMLLVVSSAVYFTMFIPMFTTPERFTRRTYKFRQTLKLYKKHPKESLGFMGYGEELLFLVAWPIFIFTVVPNFFNLGSIIALSTLVATGVVLFVGRISDHGYRRKVHFVGTSTSIISWVLRIVFLPISSLVAVFGLDSLTRLGRDAAYVSMTSTVYDRANEEDILPYVVFFEQSLSIGKLLAALIGAFVYAWSQSFVPIFILAATFTFLYWLLPVNSGPVLRPSKIHVGKSARI